MGDIPETTSEKRFHWLFSKKKLWIKVPIFVFFVISMVLYFKTFFSTGVMYEDVFMTKKVEGETTVYTGRHIDGAMKITVSDVINVDTSSEVIFHLPGDIDKKYIVSFENQKDWIGSGIIIKDGSTILFEGAYNENGWLLDKNGDFVWEDVGVRYNNISPFTSDYRIPMYSVVDFALHNGDRTRGNYALLMFALILFIITIIDYSFPLFFFNMKHSIHVNNAEPNDYYTSMQKTSWVVMPLIGVVIMIIALFKAI